MPPGQEGHVWLLGDFLGGEADATASVLPLQRPGLPVPLQAPLLSQVLFHRESEPVPGSHDALLQASGPPHLGQPCPSSSSLGAAWMTPFDLRASAQMALPASCLLQPIPTHPALSICSNYWQLFPLCVVLLSESYIAAFSAFHSSSLKPILVPLTSPTFPL